jgi:predicted dehydrogenase
MKSKSELNRRQFLAAGGIALAALPLTPLPGLSQTIPGPRAIKKVRMGIVGGGFGATFQWHEDPGCTVEAVSDLLPERRKRLMKVYNCSKSYPSLEEMVLDENIDAIAVFTGAPDHVRHTVLAMKHGKHVNCAVPACMNLEEAEELLDVVKKTGLSYMMAETSYYRQAMISARKWYEEGKFGRIIYSESEYHHPHTESLWFNPDGSRTWRHGLPPMLYPTHCTSFLTGLTGERLVEVMCLGWGDNDPQLKDNQYKSPFWNATALFKTDKGHAFRVARMRKGGVRGVERAEWYGENMSFLMHDQDNDGPVIIWPSQKIEKDDGGFATRATKVEKYQQVNWWETDMLPEPMRHNSGHGGSHTFLTHEFVAALNEGRKPAINVYESLAYTVPGIVAHQSAMAGGKQLKIRNFDQG